MESLSIGYSHLVFSSKVGAPESDRAGFKNAVNDYCACASENAVL
jgi:hypothetical protein